MNSPFLNKDTVNEFKQQRKQKQTNQPQPTNDKKDIELSYTVTFKIEHKNLLQVNKEGFIELAKSDVQYMVDEINNKYPRELAKQLMKNGFISDSLIQEWKQQANG